MEIVKRPFFSNGVEYKAVEGCVLGRGSAYFIRNSLHAEPYALVEDIFVERTERGRGVGSAILEKLIHDAQALGCYKIVAFSRAENTAAHRLYESLGLNKRGFEFRKDITKSK
jgi:GNAT superfamily N-acetyltransferase